MRKGSKKAKKNAKKKVKSNKPKSKVESLAAQDGMGQGEGIASKSKLVEVNWSQQQQEYIKAISVIRDHRLGSRQLEHYTLAIKLFCRLVVGHCKIFKSTDAIRDSNVSEQLLAYMKIQSHLFIQTILESRYVLQHPAEFLELVAAAFSIVNDLITHLIDMPLTTAIADKLSLYIGLMDLLFYYHDMGDDEVQRRCRYSAMKWIGRLTSVLAPVFKTLDNAVLLKLRYEVTLVVRSHERSHKLPATLTLVREYSNALLALLPPEKAIRVDKPIDLEEGVCLEDKVKLCSGLIDRLIEMMQVTLVGSASSDHRQRGLFDKYQKKYTEFIHDFFDGVTTDSVWRAPSRDLITNLSATLCNILNFQLLILKSIRSNSEIQISTDLISFFSNDTYSDWLWKALNRVVIYQSQHLEVHLLDDSRMMKSISSLFNSFVNLDSVELTFGEKRYDSIIEPVELIYSILTKKKEQGHIEQESILFQSKFRREILAQLLRRYYLEPENEARVLLLCRRELILLINLLPKYTVVMNNSEDYLEFVLDALSLDTSLIGEFIKMISSDMVHIRAISRGLQSEGVTFRIAKQDDLAEARSLQGDVVAYIRDTQANLDHMIMRLNVYCRVLLTVREKVDANEQLMNSIVIISEVLECLMVRREDAWDAAIVSGDVAELHAEKADRLQLLLSSVGWRHHSRLFSDLKVYLHANKSGYDKSILMRISQRLATFFLLGSESHIQDPKLDMYSLNKVIFSFFQSNEVLCQEQLALLPLQRFFNPSLLRAILGTNKLLVILQDEYACLSMVAAVKSIILTSFNVQSPTQEAVDVAVDSERLPRFVHQYMRSILDLVAESHAQSPVSVSEVIQVLDQFVGMVSLYVNAKWEIELQRHQQIKLFFSFARDVLLTLHSQLTGTLVFDQLCLRLLIVLSTAKNFNVFVDVLNSQQRVFLMLLTTFHHWETSDLSKAPKISAGVSAPVSGRRKKGQVDSASTSATLTKRVGGRVVQVTLPLALTKVDVEKQIALLLLIDHAVVPESAGPLLFDDTVIQLSDDTFKSVAELVCEAHAAITDEAAAHGCYINASVKTKKGLSINLPVLIPAVGHADRFARFTSDRSRLIEKANSFLTAPLLSKKGCPLLMGLTQLHAHWNEEYACDERAVTFAKRQCAMQLQSQVLACLKEYGESSLDSEKLSSEQVSQLHQLVSQFCLPFLDTPDEALVLFADRAADLPVKLPFSINSLAPDVVSHYLTLLSAHLDRVKAMPYCDFGGQASLKKAQVLHVLLSDLVDSASLTPISWSSMESLLMAGLAVSRGEVLVACPVSSTLTKQDAQFVIPFDMIKYNHTVSSLRSYFASRSRELQAEVMRYFRQLTDFNDRRQVSDIPAVVEAADRLSTQFCVPHDVISSALPCSLSALTRLAAQSWTLKQLEDTVIRFRLKVDTRFVVALPSAQRGGESVRVAIRFDNPQPLTRSSLLLPVLDLFCRCADSFPDRASSSDSYEHYIDLLVALSEIHKKLVDAGVTMSTQSLLGLLHQPLLAMPAALRLKTESWLKLFDYTKQNRVALPSSLHAFLHHLWEVKEGRLSFSDERFRVDSARMLTDVDAYRQRFHFAKTKRDFPHLIESCLIINSFLSQYDCRFYRYGSSLAGSAAWNQCFSDIDVVVLTTLDDAGMSALAENVAPLPYFSCADNRFLPKREERLIPRRLQVTYRFGDDVAIDMTIYTAGVDPASFSSRHKSGSGDGVDSLALDLDYFMRGMPCFPKVVEQIDPDKKRARYRRESAPVAQAQAQSSLLQLDSHSYWFASERLPWSLSEHVKKMYYFVKLLARACDNQLLLPPGAAAISLLELTVNRYFFTLLLDQVKWGQYHSYDQGRLDRKREGMNHAFAADYFGSSLVTVRAYLMLLVRVIVDGGWDDPTRAAKAVQLCLLMKESGLAAGLAVDCAGKVDSILSSSDSKAPSPSAVGAGATAFGGRC